MAGSLSDKIIAMEGRLARLERAAGWSVGVLAELDDGIAPGPALEDFPDNLVHIPAGTAQGIATVVVAGRRVYPVALVAPFLRWRPEAEATAAAGGDTLYAPTLYYPRPGDRVAIMPMGSRAYIGIPVPDLGQGG